MFRVSVAAGSGILALALLVGVADTQEKDKAKGILPPNWKNLNLTAAQKESIYNIQGQYRTKYADLNKQLKELQAKERNEMAKVLTDAQKAELVKLTTGEGGDKKAPEKKSDSK